MSQNYCANIYTFIEPKFSPLLMSEFKKLSFKGGSEMQGKSSADNALWRFMGFDGEKRNILLTAVEKEQLQNFLKSEEELHKKIRFVSVVIPYRLDVEQILIQENKEVMDYSMIETICSYGYSQEVMDKARSLGATGGTIIQAHGTAKEEDVEFFGNKITKDKEIVLIVVQNQYRDKIMEGINSLECIKNNENGSGIVFALPVIYFSKSK